MTPTCGTWRASSDPRLRSRSSTRSPCEPSPTGSSASPGWTRPCRSRSPPGGSPTSWPPSKPSAGSSGRWPLPPWPSSATSGGSTLPGNSWRTLGLTPSEYSSGDRRQLGGITKAGNGHARRALIEGAWAYRYPAKVSPSIRKRQEGLATPIQDIAWKAQVRLCKRARRLVARGKHPNVAVTAVARELAAFMWAIARQVRLAA